MKITIPTLTDTTVKLSVDGKYVGDVTSEQFNKIRIDVVQYIVDTSDTSVLDTFYVIGHKDTNTEMGEEIKITMDEFGNISDLPWEMAHVRRDMFKLIQLGKQLRSSTFK